ncbi:MAG: hypothetical protein WCT22_00470 [Patescibacteria group bacterium]|jgi:hypothetical protein
MKTRKKPYFGLGLGKLLVVLLVILGTIYFIWRFMFVINSKNSKAAETNSCGGLVPGQSRCRTTETYDQLKANGICQTKKCPMGKECEQAGDQAQCVNNNEDTCAIRKGFCANIPIPCPNGVDNGGKCPGRGYCCKGGSQTNISPTPKPKPTTKPKPTVGSCSETCVSSSAFCTGNDGAVVSGACTGSKVCCRFYQ